MSDKPLSITLGKAVVALDKSHRKRDFDCEVMALNDFLQQQAGQAMKRHQSKTYVLLADDDVSIIGYFTLATVRFDWHESVGNKYKAVNTALLIARLAVDKRFKGQGIGAYLLHGALQKLILVNDVIGMPIIAVDAKDGASEFYKPFGFQPLHDESQRLFILMETVLKSKRKSVDE